MWWLSEAFGTQKEPLKPPLHSENTSQNLYTCMYDYSDFVKRQESFGKPIFSHLKKIKSDIIGATLIRYCQIFYDTI